MIEKRTKLSELSSGQVTKIQKLLGVNADGILGPKTINKFHSWKKSKNLGELDYIGPSSYAMLLINDSVLLIKQFEGFSNKAYLGPAGIPTIGYGTTVYSNGKKVNLGDSITKEHAERELSGYIFDKILPALEKKIPYWNEMNNSQRNSLISFAYNVGENFYGTNSFKTISNVLKLKAWDSMPAAFSLYVNPGSKAEKGLRNRRGIEGRLFIQ